MWSKNKTKQDKQNWKNRGKGKCVILNRVVKVGENGQRFEGHEERAIEDFGGMADLFSKHSRHKT